MRDLPHGSGPAASRRLDRFQPRQHLLETFGLVAGEVLRLTGILGQVVEAVDTGLDVRGYTTQAHFLISCGLDEIVKQQESVCGIDSVKLSNQIKMLTMPGEMGERFKVIALTKNIGIPLLGFQFVDLRAKL